MHNLVFKKYEQMEWKLSELENSLYGPTGEKQDALTRLEQKIQQESSARLESSCALKNDIDIVLE